MIGYFLTLPMGPTINHYYRTISASKRVLTDEGKIFRAEVHNAVVRSKMPKLKGRICVVIRVFPRDRRLQDIDNRVKGVLDALMHAGAFDDDSQVDELQVTRGPIVQGGRIEVLVGEIDVPK